ncbi:hypothetical protein niasHS_002718 [Heterodera schachtii]|uniref:Uncharacterized protein n=1 Tax=Heterodera schachtii TaxID=97005 RepID=A0ABD2K2A9_HETSC
MSVLIIRNDDNCDLYNRTVVVCYTRMALGELRKYVNHLELFADDRQKIFFKIDIDISSVPESTPEARPALRGWRILTVVLKAQKLSCSFGVLVKLFYEKFPHPMLVDYSNRNIFVSSGANTRDHKLFSKEDSRSFTAILEFHEKTLKQGIELPKIFKDRVSGPSEAPKVLVELAKKYNVKGGHWIMFFNKLATHKWEKVFDELLSEALKHWGILNRFNARISSDSLIICFGNEKTLAASDPTILDSSDQIQRNNVKNDPGPHTVLRIIDEIYKPTTFGNMGVKYKLDIVSACCIQRDNFIRPTVYQANYGEYSQRFVPANLPLSRGGELQRMPMPTGRVPGTMNYIEMEIVRSGPIGVRAQPSRRGR